MWLRCWVEGGRPGAQGLPRWQRVEVGTPCWLPLEEQGGWRRLSPSTGAPLAWIHTPALVRVTGGKGGTRAETQRRTRAACPHWLLQGPSGEAAGLPLLESKGLKSHFSSLLPEWSLCYLWCAQRRKVGEMTANRALSPSPEAQGQTCTWVLDTERGWEAPRGAGGQRAGGCRGGRETCQRQGATRGPQDWMGMEVKPQQRLSGWPDPGNSNPRRTRTHPNAESCLGANVTGRAPSCHQAQGHHLRDSMA